MVLEQTIIKSFTKKLEHLGIIAALIDMLGIVDLVNDRLPKQRHHKLTHGEVVKALIINGLGFTERRLYLFSDYFENKSVERLFGKGITPEDFSEDTVGRTLDAIKKLWTGTVVSRDNQSIVSSRKTFSADRAY